MWTTCGLRHHHWGRWGAAGLLVVDGDCVLLEHRSAFVMSGNTWSIPGGALERGETPWHAALREAREEAGIDPADVSKIGAHVADCGAGWTYTTYVAALVSPVTVRGNRESQTHRWVGVNDVDQMRLHSAFRASWAELAKRVSGHE